MNRTFVLIDLSQGAKTSSGEALTPALLATFAKAYNIYLNVHVAPVYGGEYLVRVGSAAGPGEVPCNILPLLPQPGTGGAVAYHDDAGGPVVLDGLGDSAVLYGPGNSHTVSMTHEMVEVVGNPSINRWSDQTLDPGSATIQTADEWADPVEGDSFPIEVDGLAVYCSNFVLPAWSDPESSGPFDYMTSRGMPGATPPGGPFQIANGYRSDRNLKTGAVMQIGLATRRPGTISRRAWALGQR
jgi:hypothetical protein